MCSEVCNHYLKSVFSLYLTWGLSPPLQGAQLRSALRDELRLLHDKMEAKRSTRIALAEIRLLLMEEEEEREAACALKMKKLETVQEELWRERMERLMKERAAKQME